MTADPIRGIRVWINSPADAIGWACVLEATAPKVGNVFPSRRFEDLQHSDFVIAAEIVSKHLVHSGASVGHRILAAVTETVQQTGTNVNLGIVLLLGPLVAADQLLDADVDTHSTARPRTSAAWLDAIGQILGNLNNHDGGAIYDAIRRAGAGGMQQSEVSDQDVRNATGPIDIVAAMQSAMHRDRVARQYADGFTDLFESIVPVVQQSIITTGDLLLGIAEAHLRLLAAEPDTLVARKNGDEVAKDLQQRAAVVDAADHQGVFELDRSLRTPDHRLNPGTTADLIAAALYVLLRN